MVDEVTGTAIGALIAGLVGLVAVWAQLRLQRAEWVDDNILGPVYNGAKDFVAFAPVYPSDPWKNFSWYDRRRVPRRMRERIERMSALFTELTDAERVFGNSRDNTLQPPAISALKEAIKGHVDAAGTLSFLGSDGSPVRVDASSLFPWLSRFVLRHDTDPEATWRDIRASDEVYVKTYSIPIVDYFMEHDPEALKQIHAAIVNQPEAGPVLDLLRKAEAIRRVAIRQARVVVDALEKRFR